MSRQHILDKCKKMAIIDSTSKKGEIIMKDYCGNCAYLDLNQKEYWGDRY